jgi:hypothetical protein
MSTNKEKKNDKFKVGIEHGQGVFDAHSSEIGVIAATMLGECLAFNKGWVVL